jgi:hypothetical protein
METLGATSHYPDPNHGDGTKHLQMRGDTEVSPSFAEEIMLEPRRTSARMDSRNRKSFPWSPGNLIHWRSVTNTQEAG